MHLRSLTPALAGLALAATAGLAAPPTPARQCFLSSAWSGWRASPDSKAIYMRVSGSGVHRLDLAGACPELQWPSAHLVTRTHGNPWICDALDLDLKVSSGRGFATPCIVRGVARLSPAEAAALPKALTP